MTREFRGNWFCSGFDTDLLHNVEQITYARKKGKVSEANAFRPVLNSGDYSISALETVWFLKAV